MMFPIWWPEHGACVCPAAVECRSPAKHPLNTNGFKDATDDPDKLARWAAKWPEANWAIRTGGGLLVVDLDRKPGKDGLANFKALGTVPRTRTVRTGSGGIHLYFRVSGQLPNTAGKIAPGVDTRCDGGYVLAPGSRHVSGGVYETLIDCEPADAPSWLLERLHPAPAVTTTPTVRGTFAPASPAVLAAARSALDNHGPAIEGQGGDAHTWKACALLVHNHALTDDEAWPLLCEWNETCQPPWDSKPLRDKLQGGGKYGTHAYGCARTLDVMETARRMIDAWDRNEFTIPDLVAQLRALPVNDVTKRALIERNLIEATGLKSKQLALPNARTPIIVKAGDIQVTPRVHEVADAAIAAVAPHLFCRNGVLCEVSACERTFISDLEVPRIVDLMSLSANWVRVDEKGTTTQTPPATVASILHSRRSHPGVRVLEAVTTAPVFLADGSILQERGYNAQARLFLEPSVTVDVPDAPTLADAKRCVALFADLLSDFRFHEAADFSTWLAGLLSPLVKAATGNSPTPLICVSASSPGAGKTLLTDLIARIVTGAGAEVRPYNPRDPGEWGKRLTAFVRAGAPISVFDNCNGAIGDEALDRLITSTTWSDRVLGASDAPPVPCVTVWLATGNNIEPTGDTVRRVLMCRIEVDSERPQERSDFQRPLLADHVDANRSVLLSAALTILRAYHCAGRPDQRLPPWGSFTTWSSLVRGALVWTGCADPFLTQQRISRDVGDPENEVHDFWLSVVSDSDGTAGSIVTLANQRDAQGVLGTREALTTLHLRRFVGRFVDRPRAGRRIRRGHDARRNQTVYSVDVVF